MTRALTRPPEGLALDVTAARRRWATPESRRSRPDWIMIGCAIGLALVGALLVWSATRTELRADGGDPQSFLWRHLINLVIAIGLGVLAARVDARLMRLFGPLLYVAGCLGLVAVLFIGTTINGAHAWIRVGGGFEVQPAEFAKLGLIVGMAVLFAQRAVGRPPDAPPRPRDILAALSLCVPPLFLIMLQPDLGSAMVVAVAAFGVLLASGAPARWTVGLLIAGVVLAVVAVKAGVLADYQLARFKAFTEPDKDIQGITYNVYQARIAIDNGGFWGTGLFHGPQTSGAFVPEQQTDFVFSVAGEELGFFGSTLIIGGFGLLLWRMTLVARRADDAGRLVAGGIACWFAFQVFQNIGMNLGMTPVTGLPLPFVSYGGSSMFAGALAIGLLQAIRIGPRH